MLAAALAGCSREEIKPLTGGTLKLTASVPYFDIETKAGEEFTDEVTAYPLAGTALAADPVLQSYAASGSYFFTIPGGTDNIVFTTVEAAPTAYTASMDFVNGSISVSAAEGQPVGRDLIFGWLQNYSAGQTQATTDLRRASARLNVNLKSIYGVDTVSDMTSTVRSAEVTISGMYTSAVMNYKDLSYQYSGDGSITFPLSPNETGTYFAMTMTLPTNPSASSVLTLTITSNDGTARSYSSPLPSGISTNYSYNMNLLLSWDNASADFTLSDIQMNTVDMDGIPNQNFDLLQFSDNNLTFRKERGYTHTTQILNSRLGTWTADIPAEAFEYFAFRNNTKGTEATADSPVLTGEEGDWVYIHTTQNNNTGGYLRYSIPFSVSDGESTYTYYLDIIQSDGSMQSIEYNTDSYHYVQVEGNNLTYIKFDNNGNPDTLSLGSSYYNGNYEVGRYKVCGDFITSLRLDDADLTTLTFNNCTMLDDLTTYSCTGDISSIDLSSAENLERLDIDFNDTQITSIDLTHNTSLKNINIEINTLTELTLPPASDKLETLTLYNSGKLTVLDASGHIGLQTLSLSNSISALTSLTLNGCTSLSELNLSYDAGKLETLDIANCTSLKKFVLNGENLVTSLDFTGCEFIDNIEIMNNSTLSSIILPDARDLSCLKINNLSALASLALSGSSIDCLDISNCSLLPLEGYLDGSISLRSIRLNDRSDLTDLDISSTTLEELYLENCSSLTSLNVAEGNRLKKVSLNSNTSLKFLNTDLNAASTLEELRIESCSQSSDGSIPRDSIDLSGYSALRLVSIKYCYNYTYCASFEGCTSLTDLRLQSNYQLENLNLSRCTSLRTMDLYDNNLDSAALTSVLESLPNLNGTSGGQYCIRYNLPEDNNYSSIQTGIDSAADRGWTLSEEMLPDLDFSFNYN